MYWDPWESSRVCSTCLDNLADKHHHNLTSSPCDSSEPSDLLPGWGCLEGLMCYQWWDMRCPGETPATSPTHQQLTGPTDQPGGWRDPKTVQARHSNITQTEITITAATTLQYHQANRLSKLPWLPCRLLFYLVLMLRHAIQKIRSDTQIDCWHSYFDTDITVGGQRGTWEIRK